MKFALLAASCFASLVTRAGPRFDAVCTGRPIYVNRMDATTIEFTTADGVFRSVGDERATDVMLRNLFQAMSPQALFTTGVHVRERRGGITFVDDVTYDGRCRMAFGTGS